MKRFTIVGSGVYAATLCEQLAAAEISEQVEVVLAARNKERLEVIGNACRNRVEQAKPDWQVRTETDLAAAVDGADIIVLLIRVGGLDARRYDETFPGQFGQIGDEGLGLGGISNTWRTIPVLDSVAQTIKANAPNAQVINMLAPLGTTTRLLTDAGLNTVGICELPITTEEKFGGNADLFDYGGINHLGWFTPKNAEAYETLQAGMENGTVDREIVNQYGATTLFYHYRVFNQLAAERMGCAFKPGRAAQLQDLTDEVLDDFRNRPSEQSAALTARETPWFDRGLVPIVTALLGGTEANGFVNTMNQHDGQRLVPQLADNAIVEVRAKWHSGGFTPTSSSLLTDECVKFLQAVSNADDLAYRGSVERDLSLIHQAIERLPITMDRKDSAAVLSAISNQKLTKAA
ncbi:MAG: hypothetical protein AB8G99_11630 [Planctomycetaceae bacterium]